MIGKIVHRIKWRLSRKYRERSRAALGAMMESNDILEMIPFIEAPSPHHRYMRGDIQPFEVDEG